MALPVAGTAAVKETLENFIGLLKPDTWIQLVESDHSVSRGRAMGDFFRLLTEIFKMMEMGPDYALNLTQWLQEDCNLENVQKLVFDVPQRQALPL